MTKGLLRIKGSHQNTHPNPTPALCPQTPGNGSTGPAQGSHGVAHSPRGHGEQGWLSSLGTGSPQHPDTLMESTFSVLSESDNSELSCTSMSGSWYLQHRVEDTQGFGSDRARKVQCSLETSIPCTLARASLEPP